MSQQTGKQIWDFLLKEINNEYGVAGLMGNLYAESSLSSINLQNTSNSKLKMTDEEYTEAVDNGTYKNFIKDKAGYGLAQWTHWSRKESLYNYAKSTNRSIGSLTMQLEFLVTELKKDFKKVWTTLCNATSLREASDIVLTKFEQPQNQSEGNKVKRASYGEKYYTKYATKIEEKPQVEETKEPEVKQEVIKETKTEYITYTIEKGDSLSKIGKKFNVPWKDIAKLNNIKAPLYVIRAGKELTIPVIVEVEKKLEYIEYVIVKGDSLSKIGNKFNVPWKEIAEINNIEGPNYVIRVGKTLKIPHR